MAAVKNAPHSPTYAAIAVYSVLIVLLAIIVAAPSLFASTAATAGETNDGGGAESETHAQALALDSALAFCSSLARAAMLFGLLYINHIVIRRVSSNSMYVFCLRGPQRIRKFYFKQ